MLRQSKIANTALRQSTESFRIDERAWLEILPIQPILFNPRDSKFGAAFKYEIRPKNFGKTVARDIVVKAQTSRSGEEFSSNADSMRRWQDEFLLDKFKEMGTGKPVVVSRSPVPKVLAPGIEAPVPFTLTGQEPEIFKNGVAFYDYLVGRMDYVDVFGVPHWVKFCFFVANPRGELRNCQEGNDEDKNPETLRN